MSRCFLGSVLSLFCALAPLAGADMPRRSPEFAIKLTSGRELLLSSYRGKVVALMFISTDCPHCQATCQLMEKIQQEYGPRGFQTLAVAFNDMAIMLVPDFIKQTGVTFPVGYDSRGSVFSYLQRSETLQTFVPIMTFIDRKGMIRGQFLGDDPFFQNQEQHIRSLIEKLLAEPTGVRGSRGGAKKGS